MQLRRPVMQYDVLQPDSPKIIKCGLWYVIHSRTKRSVVLNFSTERIKSFEFETAHLLTVKIDVQNSFQDSTIFVRVLIFFQTKTYERYCIVV